MVWGQREKLSFRLTVLLICFGLFLHPFLEARSNGFVTRNGDRLVHDGQDFYFTGVNAYALLLDAALGDTLAVHEVFMDAVSLNAKVIRTWAFHDSPDSLNPTVIQYRPGVFNEQALVGLDHLIARARIYEVKLLFALVNNWDDFGGMNQYVEWRAERSGGIAGTLSHDPSIADRIQAQAGRSYRVAVTDEWGHDDFYTDSLIRDWYKNYVASIVQRVNSYTGIAYRDEPAIMGWELANEPRSSDRSGSIVHSWIVEMSAFLRSVDPNHLIGTGEEGFDVVESMYASDSYNGQSWLFDGTAGVAFRSNTEIDLIDFGSVHLYPDFWSFSSEDGNTWIVDHARIASILQKPLLLGEFGVLSEKELAYRSWLATSLTEGVAGALPWQLLQSRQADSDGLGFRCPEDSLVCGVLKDAALNFERRSDGSIVLPASFMLSQNFPNPFNTQTIIPYDLPSDSYVMIDIWDVSGRKVDNVVAGVRKRGAHYQLWHAGNTASGVYCYRLMVGGFLDVKKLIVTK